MACAVLFGLIYTLHFVGIRIPHSVADDIILCSTRTYEVNRKLDVCKRDMEDRDLDIS